MFNSFMQFMYNLPNPAYFMLAIGAFVMMYCVWQLVSNEMMSASLSFFSALSLITVSIQMMYTEDQFRSDNILHTSATVLITWWFAAVVLGFMTVASFSIREELLLSVVLLISTPLMIAAFFWEGFYSNFSDSWALAYGVFDSVAGIIALVCLAKFIKDYYQSKRTARTTSVTRLRGWGRSA